MVSTCLSWSRPVEMPFSVEAVLLRPGRMGEAVSRVRHGCAAAAHRIRWARGKGKAPTRGKRQRHRSTSRHFAACLSRQASARHRRHATLAELSAADLGSAAVEPVATTDPDSAPEHLRPALVHRRRTRATTFPCSCSTAALPTGADLRHQPRQVRRMRSPGRSATERQNMPTDPQSRHPASVPRRSPPGLRGGHGLRRRRPSTPRATRRTTCTFRDPRLPRSGRARQAVARSRVASICAMDARDGHAPRRTRTRCRRRAIGPVSREQPDYLRTRTTPSRTRAGTTTSGCAIAP